ncbi:MAG TPA: hypothetical protein VGV92_05530 [Gammaproteobacteria bacterium]|nr:hypothetical protein [Gammaproteobacteria bacterium]
MGEIELFLGNEAWQQSWLLDEITISSDTATFSGTVTAESLEWVDPKTVRCLLTVESTLPSPIEDHPSVITSNTNIYPNITRLSPSAGTSWPIPESSELLVGFIQNNLNQPIALGSLYNNDKTDPVCNMNSSEHILRANDQTEIIMDDENPTVIFNHKKNNISLTQDLKFNTITGNIMLNASQNIIYHSQEHTHETSENNYTRTVQQNFSVNTQIGHMNYEIGNNLKLISNNNINLSSPQTISIQSQAAINLSATLSLMSQKGINITSSGEINISSDNNLTIIGEENIQICSGGSTIEITKEGVINFNAPSITISGQPILSVRPTSPG